MTDSSDYCQREHPMSFCKVCGTWMHCKRDGDADYTRRPDHEEPPPPQFAVPSTNLLQEMEELQRLMFEEGKA